MPAIDPRAAPGAPDEEPKLSAGNAREYRVVTFLSADEFISLTHLCEGLGLSQSAYIRMLLRKAAQAAADAAHSDATPRRGESA